MIFKTEEQKVQWESWKLSEKLKSIILMVEQYMLAKYDYEITITDIYRTQEEQDEIYKDNEKYKKKPWLSTHQFYRAIDIRTRDMTKEMVFDIVELCNRIPYDDSRPQKKTCLAHDVGNGYHLHVQQA